MASTSLNWQTLRCWQGSQNRAFEELCAQLAAAEAPAAFATFFRKGVPDGGVECYWRLANGDEWAWQAKFFDSIGTAQLQQLDESVKTALDKHPRLVRYFICVPLDRADPRIDGKTFAMDRWEEHEKTWESWARDRGMNVIFPYWGNHEISDRLMRDEHRGRLFYWFDEQLFSRQWFDHRLEEAIANADQRYLSELNVDLPVKEIFRGLGRTPEFFVALKTRLRLIREAYRYSHGSHVEALAFDSATELARRVLAVEQVLNDADICEMGALPLERIRDSAAALGAQAGTVQRILLAAERRKPNREGEAPMNPTGRSFGSEIHFLSDLQHHAWALAEFTQSPEALLANKPALLLVGSAGTGKTHLLCHLATERKKVDLPTVIILSEQLANGQPWTEILNVLKLRFAPEEMLGALDAAGQARGSRVIIAIDAVNEGEGREMWERHLPGFLVSLSRYPWVGLVISIRSSYESAVIATNLTETRLVRVEHRGFYGAEARATIRFFTHYGIVAPTIPPLHPEFSNPLFLRLFCQALQNLGYRQVPPGFHGLTAVFTFFLAAANAKIARNLDFDPATEPVQRCVDQIASAMAEAKRSWLPLEEARALAESCLSSHGHSKSLLHQLVLEGVLARDRFHKVEGDWTEGIRFTYEKFSDHLIARHLLNKHLVPGDPATSFAPGTPLFTLISDEFSHWRQNGIIGALAVQLPERVGQELPELIPDCASYSVVREAVADSIIWRDVSKFTEATTDYLNDWLLSRVDTFRLAMSALLTVAAQIDHPWNSHALHRHLCRSALPDRDSWWSTYLHHEYWDGESNVLVRLLDWCEIPEGKSDLSDESLVLAAIPLTWCFSSSNRFLRDRATKALVQLMTPRVDLMASLIEMFADVDDPYVLERLTAAAYGCAMRSCHAKQVHALARACYRVLFQERLPVHVLTRDYARGVVERALFLRPAPAFDPVRFRPPYGSTWPDEIPSAEEQKSLGWSDSPPVHPAQRTLYFSVIAGDFSRYVIGTNSGGFEWLSLLLSGPPPLSRGKKTRAFITTLSPQQRTRWNKFRRAFRTRSRRPLSHIIRFIDAGGARQHDGVPPERRDSVAQAKEALCNLLSAEQRRALEEDVVPFLQHGGRRSPQDNRFDLGLIERYILQRVFALGWTSEKLGEFDHNLPASGRESHKAERLGKKYQWIAYYEVLARISDRFVFAGSSWSQQQVRFEGPWQVSGLRDIDPSIVLKETARDSCRSRQSCWWVPAPYQDWHRIRSQSEWLQATHDLPLLAEYVRVTDPADGSRWLTLEAYYSWEEPTPADREWSDLSHRSLWYHVQAYIVRKRDASMLFSWAQEQDFWGGWRPESREFHDLFFGELYWSPAYEERFSDSRGDSAWERGYRSERFPTDVVVPSMKYGGIGTSRDCSMEESVHMYVPAPWLAEHLSLQWAGVEGEFRGPEGNLVARDPSITTRGPGALLVEERALRSFLDSKDYEIVWTVVGAKQIIGEHPRVDTELHLSGAFAYQNANLVGQVRGMLVAY